MKKILIITLMMIAGTSVYAQFLQIGPVAMYTSPVNKPEGVPSYNEIGLEDFRFGADLRLNFGLLQVAMLAVMEAPGPNALLEPGKIVLIPTAGINASVLIFDFGIGVGPSFEFYFGDSSLSEPADFGLNVKGTADINLGKVSLGMIVGTAFNLTGEGSTLGENMDIYGGIAFLFNI